MQVSSLLSGKQVQTITPDATIKELSQSLTELKIGALVVSSDGRNILGIVSERDIVQALPSFETAEDEYDDSEGSYH